MNPGPSVCTAHQALALLPRRRQVTATNWIQPVGFSSTDESGRDKHHTEHPPPSGHVQKEHRGQEHSEQVPQEQPRARSSPLPHLQFPLCQAGLFLTYQQNTEATCYLDVPDAPHSQEPDSQHHRFPSTTARPIPSLTCRSWHHTAWPPCNTAAAAVCILQHTPSVVTQSRFCISHIWAKDASPTHKLQVANSISMPAAVPDTPSLFSCTLKGPI